MMEQLILPKETSGEYSLPYLVHGVFQKKIFWKNSKLMNVVNSLKLRVGYGVTGNNAIGSSKYTTNYSQTTYPMGNNENNSAYVVGTTLGNKDLKWETLHATNIGLDISLFNSRVNFDC